MSKYSDLVDRIDELEFEIHRCKHYIENLDSVFKELLEYLGIERCYPECKCYFRKKEENNGK